jgi:hypothetical protein
MKRQILKITTLSLFAVAILAAPALDANAMTLTVGKLTVQVTSETKITKDGKPATLADGVVGEPASGYYKKDADGKLSATTIHFGSKKKETSDASSSTNSVSK